jgi:hypothetical protein
MSAVVRCWYCDLRWERERGKGPTHCTTCGAPLIPTCAQRPFELPGYTGPKPTAAAADPGPQDAAV